MPGARKKEELSFEKAMERLEALVEALEGEGVPIEEALKHFEEGMELVAVCEKKLHEVRKRVEKILEKKGDAPAGEDDPYPSE
jgi:exodeoxyribonuclease VII small subunit